MKTCPKETEEYNYIKDSKEQPKGIEKKSIQSLCDNQGRMVCIHEPVENCNNVAVPGMNITTKQPTQICYNIQRKAQAEVCKTDVDRYWGKFSNIFPFSVRKQNCHSKLKKTKKYVPFGMEEAVKDRISNFCHMEPSGVINIQDLASIYHVLIEMHRQGVVNILKDKLMLDFEIPKPRKFMTKWCQLADRSEHLRKFVKIALVGKYTQLSDAYASVMKALGHAALAANHKLQLVMIAAADLEEEAKVVDPVKYHEAWKALCEVDGVLVPGGFGVRGTQGKMEAARWCRTTGKPYLGVCLGLQCAVIEFARNVLHWADAHSTEMNPETTHPVVIDMPEHTQVRLHMVDYRCLKKLGLKFAFRKFF